MLQAATAEVRLDPAKSARFSSSVAWNDVALLLYRQRVRFTIAQTRQWGDLGPGIAGNRAVSAYPTILFGKQATRKQRSWRFSKVPIGRRPTSEIGIVTASNAPLANRPDHDL